MILNFGADGNVARHLFFGWSTAEPNITWAVGERSILTLAVSQLPETPEILMRLRMFPVLAAGISAQRLTIRINEELIGQAAVRSDQQIELFFSRSLVDRREYAFVEFVHPDGLRPSDFTTGADNRLLSVAFRSIEFAPFINNHRSRPKDDRIPGLDCTRSDAAAVQIQLQNRFQAISEALKPENGSYRQLLVANAAGIAAQTQPEYLRLREALDAAARKEGVITAEQSVFDKYGRIADHFLEIQDLSDHLYFKPLESTTLQRTLVLTSSGESYPGLDGFRLYPELARTMRPDLFHYSQSGCKVVVDPYFYQVIDKSESNYWISAAPRPVSKKVINSIPNRKIEGGIVIIQDLFMGNNFSHFLFDYVTRLIHFVKEIGKRDTPVQFVMGGFPTEFHSIVLTALCETCDIDYRAFLFPRHTELLDVEGDVHWFSDQVEAISFPAQGAHPKSLAALSILSERIAAPLSDADKVYISRFDASFRKPTNEVEVAQALARVGYRTVIMSNYTIRQQIAIVRSAKSIVANHGMGLTCIALHAGGLKLVELLCKTRGSDCYGIIACARGFDYCPVFFDAVDESANYYVNIQALLEHCA